MGCPEPDAYAAGGIKRFAVIRYHYFCEAKNRGIEWRGVVFFLKNWHLIIFSIIFVGVNSYSW